MKITILCYLCLSMLSYLNLKGNKETRIIVTFSQFIDMIYPSFWFNVRLMWILSHLGTEFLKRTLCSVLCNHLFMNSMNNLGDWNFGKIPQEYYLTYNFLILGFDSMISLSIYELNSEQGGSKPLHLWVTSHNVCYNSAETFAAERFPFGSYSRA
jgi:hypothetical protein